MVLLGPVIRSPRLDLVTLGLDDARQIVHGYRPETARWSGCYPTDSSLVAAGMVVASERDGQSLGDWGTYQVVRRKDKLVIGDGSFLGPPDPDGVVHVSCSVCEDDVEASFAAEALRAMIAWARAKPGVKRVLADTHAANFPLRIALVGAGMRRVGADDRLIYYEG
jgi:RimJ/RimL family protein N-acetyltransferase